MPEVQDPYVPAPCPKDVRIAIEKLCEIEPRISIIEAEAGELLMRTSPPNFESLVRIVSGQQVSTAAAQTIFGRLKEAVVLDPASVLAAEMDLLRGAGLSGNKALFIKEIAREILNGLDLEALAHEDDEEIEKRLVEIKGVGPWSAHIFMLFCLQRPDVFPVADLALQVGFQRVMELESRPNAIELKGHVEKFRPHRSALAHLLWHYYRIRVSQEESKAKRG